MCPVVLTRAHDFGQAPRRTEKHDETNEKIRILTYLLTYADIGPRVE